MHRKKIIWTISIYKILASLFRIFLGIFLIYFAGNIEKIKEFILSSGLIKDSSNIIFKILLGYIKPATPTLTYILALSLIVLSIADIFFIIILLYRRKWGAIGFLIVSILWVPVEILFISKFLVVSKTLALIIDFIIIYFLYRLITRPRGYFKK